MLQSYIVQKDADTLIVSQHVPVECDGEPDQFCEFKGERVPQLDQSYIKEKTGNFMVAQTIFNKKKEGSLLDLFESPHMTVHMIIHYLHTMNKKHIIEYLVNKLHREYRHDVKAIDFYLPQLCYISITKMGVDLSMPVERFIL